MLFSLFTSFHSFIGRYTLHSELFIWGTHERNSFSPFSAKINDSISWIRAKPDDCITSAKKHTNSTEGERATNDTKIRAWSRAFRKRVKSKESIERVWFLMRRFKNFFGPCSSNELTMERKSSNGSLMRWTKWTDHTREWHNKWCLWHVSSKKKEVVKY